jgi:hypothetical protein
MLAAALRAQASAGGRPMPPAGGRRRVGWLLLLALLVGLAIGTGLALVSLLAPGVLPGIG